MLGNETNENTKRNVAIKINAFPTKGAKIINKTERMYIEINNFFLLFIMFTIFKYFRTACTIVHKSFLR